MLRPQEGRQERHYGWSGVEVEPTVGVEGCNGRAILITVEMMTISHPRDESIHPGLGRWKRGDGNSRATTCPAERVTRPSTWRRPFAELL